MLLNEFNDFKKAENNHVESSNETITGYAFLENNHPQIAWLSEIKEESFIRNIVSKLYLLHITDRSKIHMFLKRLFFSNKQCTSKHHS